METVDVARACSFFGHMGQTRDDGTTTFAHTDRVAKMLKDPVLQTIAYLHDIVEDTPATCGDLLLLGFSREIVTAVDLLSIDKEKHTYLEYIQRLIDSDNELAMRVKLADLTDNLNKATKKRVKRYNRAYLMIYEALYECMS